MGTATDRIAIVTGAGNGIGRATAERLVDDHAGVVLVDRDAEALAWASGDERYVTVVGDVSTEETNAAAVDAALETFGRLDTVVLNAASRGPDRWPTCRLRRHVNWSRWTCGVW